MTPFEELKGQFPKEFANWDNWGSESVGCLAYPTPSLQRNLGVELGRGPDGRSWPYPWELVPNGEGTWRVKQNQWGAQASGRYCTPHDPWAVAFRVHTLCPHPIASPSPSLSISCASCHILSPSHCAPVPNTYLRWDRGIMGIMPLTHGRLGLETGAQWDGGSMGQGCNGTGIYWNSR